MKNKIFASIFICFLLSYVGCKKAELDTPMAPPIDVKMVNSKMYTPTLTSHYTYDDLNQFVSGNKGKCNKCHSISK